MAREVLAIVVARGGSKGLRNKHLLPIDGRPVIDYTFDHARRSKTVTRIVLSTDSGEIAAVARRSGVEVIERPRRLATSKARIDGVLYHALDVLAETDGYHPDGMVLLYGNIPLRESRLIDQAVRKLFRTGADSVRSFQDVGKWHPQWMVRMRGDRVSPFSADTPYTRQQLEPLFVHDGGVVALNAKRFAARRRRAGNFSIFGRDARGIITESCAVLEIDDMHDYLFVKSLIEHAGRHGTC